MAQNTSIQQHISEQNEMKGMSNADIEISKFDVLHG